MDNSYEIRERIIILAHQLENMAIELFRQAGYMVSEQSYNRRSTYDFYAEKEDRKYCIEVKSSTSAIYHNIGILQRYIQGMINEAKRCKAIPVILVFAMVNENTKKRMQEQYDLVIMDIANLLYATKGSKLHDKIVSVLPFSVEQIEYKEGEIDIELKEQSEESDSLLSDLEKCVEGKSDAARFEDVCCRMLEFIFLDDLSLWKRQLRSNSDIYRFDMLCRIKDNTGKALWSLIEKFFNSKYIVFEYKNYNDKITQKEVYTTERYLYKKALRNVAIIIARNGYDNNSLWAAKGSLRENGKLIILVTLDELKEMYKIKKDQEDPTEYLLGKIDNLLIELEK